MSPKERFYADVMSMHSEVTGSCNLVIVKLPDRRTIRFIVDCGLFHEEKYNDLNQTFPFEPKNIDFCLVTHNHVDHTGRLPLLVKKGFYKNIYTTETTCKLLPYALYDSYKVLKDVAKRKHCKNLYEEGDIERTLSHVQGCRFDQEIQVHENVKVTFFENGHLVGAAIILVQITYLDETINLLFTGDYNCKNVFFDVTPVPKRIFDLPLIVIQESTYGDMDTTEIEKCFKENVMKCIECGGTVIAPVFSLGRSQEILYELKTMQQDGILDVGVPIYLDGKLAINYTELYKKDGLDNKPEMQDFLPDNLTLLDKVSRLAVLEDEGTKIVLTTSGMGSYGPAQLYIPEYITRDNALIHFTGYTAEGTLGHDLKNSEIGSIVKVGGVFVEKRAQVEYTKEYSAHAKADEMIDFLKQFTNLKLVLVNHGEEDVKNIFAERIVKEVKPKRVGVLGRDYFFRVNQYGLIKTMGTRFE